MNKKNNKGFSLVELIVVVAIMAVLVGVLAPALLSYVEKTRLQKDISAIGEVANACEIAMADEDVYEEVSKNAVTIQLTNSATTPITGNDDTLKGEVGKIIPSVTLSSTKLTAAVDVKVSVANGVVTVEVSGGGTDADWVDAMEDINGNVEESNTPSGDNGDGNGEG